MLLTFLKEKTFLVIFIISLAIAAALTAACWHMNFWPSDAEVYYMPAAKDLFHHPYLSSMHQALDEERIKWLHGKEMHVLAIAVLQRLMQDTETLRPLLLLGVLSIFFSTIFIFLIARKLWGKTSAVVVWFLFASSFWPYLYVLFTKHQTQGLMFFLLSALILVFANRAWVYLIAGMAMATSIFSSTVSMLYVPLVIAIFCLYQKQALRNVIIFGVGFIGIVVFVNWPDVMGNLKSYAAYVKISGAMNHFFYNQRVLVQWLPTYDLKDTRAGFQWVIKYLILVIPFILAIFAWCLNQSFKRYKQTTFLMLVLSVSGIVMAELKGVAQYGANYFPVLIGMLMFIGWSLKRVTMKRWWVYIAAVIFVWNAYIFANEIYPSRMVTTQISDYLSKNSIKTIYTFRQHVLRPNILDHLNPSTLSQLSIVPIESVVQVSDGYILLPPISSDSIYRASNGDYNDFDSDLMLNNIVRQGKLKDYAVKGFKTLGSSLIWSQEEEIFAYRNLVRQQFKDSDLNKAWILDAAKIAKDKMKFIPSQDDLMMQQHNIRNIGSLTRQNMFTSYQGGVAKDTALKGLAARIYKVGNPTDNLRAFVFKVDDKQPMWIPYAPAFISKPLPANRIGSDLQSEPAVFTFDPPLNLQAGAFSVVIYRDGKPSDQDFYRIYADVLGRIE